MCGAQAAKQQWLDQFSINSKNFDQRNDIFDQFAHVYSAHQQQEEARTSQWNVISAAQQPDFDHNNIAGRSIADEQNPINTTHFLLPFSYEDHFYTFIFMIQ